MTSPVAPSAKQVPKKVRITNGADSGMNSIGRLLFALALLRCPLSTARCGIRDAAEASLASAKLCNRQVKILGAEFRPHARSEDQLGVGALPKEKIAESLFAAGADEQIHIGSAVVIDLAQHTGE